MAPLKGFDPRYADLPDFILKVTREIWETRRVHTLHRHYAPDIKVRSPASLVIGNESVIAATLATQAEFPDRELLGEDVIWSGSPEEGKGMLSSHRILSVATHSHDGSYGRATGRRVGYRVIADCHALDNRIDDEWIIRDQGAIVRQLGWDPVDYTRHVIESEGGPEACPRPFLPEADVAGPYSGRGNDNEWGEKYAGILRRIMECDLSVIPAEYDRACRLEYRARRERQLPRLRRPLLDGASREPALRGVHDRPPDRTRGSPDAASGRPALESARPPRGLGALRGAERGRHLPHGHVARRVRAMGTAPRVRAL